MKWGLVLGVGGVCLGLTLAAATRHLWLSGASAPGAAAATPVATPPGITMQLANHAKDAPPGAPQIVFADDKGMTLYSYARDAAACVGDCARAFKPALAVQEAQGASDWSVLARADGSRQWCYRGAPLYGFSGDAAPGDIKGQGADGGAWHVAEFLADAGTLVPGSIIVRHLPEAGGTALATLDGLTLYAFDGSAAHPVPDRWRPFEAGAMASAAGDFTLIARPDGITQWAYRGHPLYLFDGDRKPGELRGAGVDDRFRVALIRRYFMPADAGIRWITGLGNALVTRDGAALYERDRVQPGEDNHDFRSDHGPPALGRLYGTTTCDATCGRTWPPYAAPATAVASGYWDVLTRSDGSKQWAYRGFALYRYSNDAPGEARGNSRYELVRIDEAGPGDPADQAHPPLQLSARDEAAYVKFAAPGNASGIGVGALFWHAVAP